MSMDPQMIAQLLMRQGQGGQGGTAQGGQAYSPSGAGQAANLLQQVLMAQQLKQRSGQQGPTQPGTPGAQMGPGGLSPNGWVAQQPPNPLAGQQ